MDMSVAEMVHEAVRDAALSLTSPGDWLDGPQRRAAWVEARDARTNELDQARRDAISPNAVAGKHEATPELAAEAVEVVHRISSDPGRLTRAWCDEMVAAIGEETYTELVGVTAIAAAIDTFAWALVGGADEIAEATAGDPARLRPESVGDVGAWVAQSVDTPMANVSRSLSLVPQTNAPWIDLVQALYSRGPGFLDLEWQRALSRPQVELVAARTTAELECFY